ncbi:MAG: hypothetical protein IKV16_04590 [Clostridia bacterium]|nr:hypothetical protein [Clostridia bacterium]
MELKKTVCYEDFGAVGDGKTDDFDAIAKAHAYANENGLDVVCSGDKTYYIGSTAINEKENKPAVKIKTNVNWGKSKFIIDDSGIASTDNAKNAVIFFVCSDYPVVTYTEENDTPTGLIKKINTEGGFKKDITRLDTGIDYKAMLDVTDANGRVYIRYGPNKNAGGAQSEIVCVDENGNIDPTTPFLLDYKAISAIYAYRIEDTPITLKGGIFTTVANQAKEDYRYYQRNMVISRSNVTVDGLTYNIEGEGEHGDPYSAFLSISKCANVLIINSFFQAHKYYMCVGSGGGSPVGMGTYAISASRSNNVVWKNCVQTNFFMEDGVTRRYGIWGIMGSSYSKNLAYEDSILSRFDAHAGVYNSRIVNSTLSSFRIIGGGDITIENCHIYTDTLIGLREDYGSTWNGRILVKDVTVHNGAEAETNLVYGQWYNHDFGYKTYIPSEVVIDGLTLTKPTEVNIFTKRFVEQSKNAHLDEIDGAPNVNKMTPPKRIVIKNNKNGYKFVKPESEFFKNTEFIIED